MWIPKEEAQIVSVVEQGSLRETANFDAKAEVSKSSTEIAKDIAAMTVSGGVLIYGIGEDKNDRLTVLSPVTLAGQRERINSIAQTAISEPPTIYIHSIPTSDDPTRGYIVVEVPQSPRAPHMVTVKKKDRFYGRNSSGNCHLSESEIARLYARRQELEIDRDVVLQQEIDRYSYEPGSDLAYLYAFIRPVFLQTNNLLERVHKGNDSDESVLWRLTDIARKQFVVTNYSPRLGNPHQWVPTVDGYRGDIGISNDSLHNFIRLEIDTNGSGHFFCGRAAEMEPIDGNERFLFFPSVAAGNITQFLYLFGNLYNQAEYNGQVDIGVALIGIKGCVPDTNYRRSLTATPYEHNEYRRTKRCSARDLLDNPQAVTSDLVLPLVRAIAGKTPRLFLPVDEQGLS